MLRQSELVALERSLRGTRTLSVYLNGESTDPARRHVWRATLDEEIVGLRASLREAPHAEREAFDRSVERLRGLLAPLTGPLGSPGYAAFVTDDEVVYAEALPLPMAPTLAWGNGIRIAPYVRALKQLRPAIVAVVDSRRARLYRYERATLDPVETIRGHAKVGPIARSRGGGGRAGFHQPTRGQTGADEADRVLREGTARLMRETADRIAKLAGEDGWVIVGGTKKAAHALQRALPETLAPRALISTSLHLSASENDIARAAEEGARTLRRDADLAAVAQVIERRTGDQRGVVGLEPTLRALRERAVGELYFTPAVLASHPADAEEAVEEALDQGALVEEVSGEAATRLDAAGDGIGATLRFVPLEGTTPVPTA